MKSCHPEKKIDSEKYFITIGGRWKKKFILLNEQLNEKE